MRLSLIRRLIDLPRYAAYLYPALVTLAFLLVRSLFDLPFEVRPLMIVFIPAIICGAFIGGLRGGLTATAVASGGIYYLFVRRTADIWAVAPHDFAQWAVLVLSGVMISLSLEMLRRAIVSQGVEAMALRGSEEFNRKIIENSPDCIIILDEDGRIAKVSQSGLKLLKLGDSKQAAGRAFVELWDAPHRPDCREAVRAAGDGGVGRFTGSCSDAAGRPMWWEAVIAPLDDASGRRYLAITRDITERVRAEEALRESEHRLRTLINAMPDIVCLKDGQGRWLEANAFACEMFKLSGEDYQGKSDAILAQTHPDRRDAFLCCDATDQIAWVSQISIRTEETIPRPDGATLVFDVVKTPSFHPDGRRKGLVVVGRDITERKRLDQAMTFLATSSSAPSGSDFFQALARYLAKALGMDFVCIDRLEGEGLYARTLAVWFDGRFEDNITYALKDTPCGDVVGNTICSFSSGVRHLYPHDAVLQDMAAESYLGVTLWDATGRPCGLIAVIGRRPMKDTKPAESLLQLVGVRASGELERLQAEEALRKAKDTAEAASKAKSEFLANMSHEIRTPLNGVLGMLQLLETTAPTEEQKDYLLAAIKSTNRLTSLLADILDLSKIEAGKLPVVEAEFSLDGLRQSIEELFSLTAKGKDLRLAFTIDPRIAPVLVGDEARLRQILFNLVGNAIKFTEKGAVLVDCVLLPYARLHEVRVLFTVSDTGIGIPAEKVMDVFEPFTQAEGTYTRRFQGAGLGLTIVRKLVTLLGGSMGVDSAAGEGTALYVSLPFKLSRALDAPGACARPQPAAIRPGRPKVLFTEDDEVSIITGRRMLEKSGCEVVVARHGKEALDRLAAEDFDLVLMDVQMPVMDGLEATRAIRASADLGDKALAPIVAMTAYSMAGDREKFLAAGMDAYIAKPVDMAELRRVVAQMLDLAARRRPGQHPPA